MHCRALALLLLLQVGYVEPTPIERARDKAVAAGYPASAIVLAVPGLVAYYEPNARAIYLNLAAPYWSDPATRQLAMYMDDEMSTASPDHIIRHEIGHGVLDAIVGHAEFDRYVHTRVGLPDDVILKVSNYARWNAAEFFAEVHAGLLAKKTYGDEVMKVYRAMARQ